MLLFLSGQDSFQIRERERELTADFLARHPGAERTVLFLDEGVPDITGRVRELLSGGLFATAQVISLREIGGLSDQEGAELGEVLERSKDASEYLVIASQAGPSKKTGSLVKALLKIATCEKFPGFDPKNPRELALYGKKFLKKIDPRATIADDALLLLSERAQGRAGKLAQELSKLAVYKNGDAITKGDVELLSQEPVESNVFLALDALVSGKRGEAIALFRREEKLSAPIQKTLGLCAWQIRRMIEVGELYESGMRDAGAIARELGLSPYPIQKILPKISRFSHDRLKRGIILLADLDLGIRSGQMQPGVALDLFVWKF